jgi:hypothetical protein
VLEIFVLVSMCRYLHRTATNKGHAGWPFVLLMIFGWFAGGIAGGVAGLLLLGDDGEFPVGALIGYFGGAALSCLGNALIVAMLPDRSPDWDGDRHDDERSYAERRRREGARRARLDDDDEGDMVDLQTADDRTREADRQWRRKWGDR